MPQDAAPETPPTWKAQKITIRTERPWAVWLGGLSAHCKLPASSVLAIAAERFAESVGYNYPPPARGKRPALADVGHLTHGCDGG
jgi:hypothetical protein